MTQKKKTYWPGQELDDEDVGSGHKTAKNSAEINKPLVGSRFFKLSYLLLSAVVDYLNFMYIHFLRF